MTDVQITRSGAAGCANCNLHVDWAGDCAGCREKFCDGYVAPPTRTVREIHPDCDDTYIFLADAMRQDSSGVTAAAGPGCADEHDDRVAAVNNQSNGLEGSPVGPAALPPAAEDAGDRDGARVSPARARPIATVFPDAERPCMPRRHRRSAGDILDVRGVGQSVVQRRESAIRHTP